MQLARIGKKTLGKKVTPHMLRHSSATFYANKLRNPYKLCYRYGWTMSSKQVDRYLDREGIFEGETSIAVKTDELSRMGRENQTLREELSLVKEAHSNLSASFRKLREDLDSIQEGKGILTLLFRQITEQDQLRGNLQEFTGRRFDLTLDRDSQGDDLADGSAKQQLERKRRVGMEALAKETPVQ
jgi:hypothetical protein